MAAKYSAFFGEAPVDTVGTIGRITDNTYNKQWVIYSISGNTYQLFPMKNLTNHKMDSYDTNDGGYEDSKMYIFIHDTILPNLKKSGLNITACDLIPYKVYQDIWSKTGIKSATIAGGEEFWLPDPYPYDDESFYYIYSDGSIIGASATYNIGVRPLITVVKERS